jgi:hypothetical protein
MNEWELMVKAFHNKFGLTVGRFPKMREAALRWALINEEVNLELKPALIAGDLVGAADAIGDAIYVLLGTAVSFGIKLEPIFMAIHNANMAKEGGSFREDGKLVKPPNWVAPDIESLLKSQGWRGFSEIDKDLMKHVNIDEKDKR